MNRDIHRKIENALDEARKAPGNTLLVLVSPTQAQRLYLAMQIADVLAKNDPEDINTLAALVPQYREAK